MYNHVTLVGRLGRDPETKFTASGKAVANFSIATDEGFGDKKKTTWHNIVCWEKTAEAVQKYVKKGSLVLVDGRIQVREWEDKAGGKKKAFEIVANRVQFLDKAKPAAEGEGSQEAGDDDIPF